MKLVKHTVRLRSDVDRSVVSLARSRNMTSYAVLPLCVEAGIAALGGPAPRHTADRELLTELATLNPRLDDLQRLVDRTLFTACAAYCYARSAAKRDGKAEDIIRAEIDGAYARQRAMAEEQS